MSQATLRCPIQFQAGRKGSAQATPENNSSASSIEPGRVPRVSRLMALAIRFDSLIAQGQIKNCAELARLGHVTRARMTQIMNLLHLAPDIQEQILFLPRVESGRDRIKLTDLQPLTMLPDWRAERCAWRKLIRGSKLV